MKKILLGVFLFAIFAFFSFPAAASSDLNIYLFWSESCPHCVNEKEYLNKLEKEYPDIAIYDFEISNNKESAVLLEKLNRQLGIEVRGVPLTIIGGVEFSGFSEKVSPEKFEGRIEYCLKNDCPDPVAEIAGVLEADNSDHENCIHQEESQADGEETEREDRDNISLPLLGKVDPASFSLPVLTVIIGALDGFNPCAMWTLLFLISLLLGMKNRKRMWILGTAFIVASAAVYYLFMAAWLNLILFLGFIFWVRIVIGLLALGGGSYNLREFFVNKDGGCKVTGGEKRQKVFEKLKLITQMNSFWLALGGIVLLAFAVNLVELICSAGLPAVYTQILALNDLAAWQYYSYILLYILIFMLDDLFIFFIAMITLEMTGVTTKYSRASKLIGGILMLIIGMLLIFKPEFLMFG